jgi:hypothetical protein
MVGPFRSGSLSPSWSFDDSRPPSPFRLPTPSFSSDGKKTSPPSGDELRNDTDRYVVDKEYNDMFGRSSCSDDDKPPPEEEEEDEDEDWEGDGSEEEDDVL